MTWKLVITLGLALGLLAGCATSKDVDECYRGDRSRCPGTGALMLAER